VLFTIVCLIYTTLGNAKQHLTALDNNECMSSTDGTVTRSHARCPNKCS